MGVLVLTNAKVLVNSVDLSDHVTSVTLDTGADDVDTTAMGATFKNRTGGLKEWSVQLTFQQDYASGKVDATIWPLLGTTTTVSINPVNAANSATNPNYSGSVLVSEYPAISGSVGELSTASVTWPGAGTLTRATS